MIIQSGPENPLEKANPAAGVKLRCLYGAAAPDLPDELSGRVVIVA